MEPTPEGPLAIPNWINGHPLMTVTERYFDVVNPQTGVAQRRVPLCGAQEVDEAVAAAQEAQSAWSELGMAGRQTCLLALADGLERYAGHFAKLLVDDAGVESEAAEAEVAGAIAALRQSAVGMTGVLGVVADGASPLAALARAMAPALLAGATLVVKPSPKSPSATFALCELTGRAAWPAGVVNVVQGDTAAVEGLCRSAIDRLVFAGTSGLAASLQALAERHGKPFQDGAA